METILLIGPSRCGKTYMATIMCKDKRSVFYNARISDLKTILKNIDTNVDIMVFDDISEKQLKDYESLIRGDYFQGDFTVVLTTNFFPEWAKKYPDVFVRGDILKVPALNWEKMGGKMFESISLDFKSKISIFSFKDVENVE